MFRIIRSSCFRAVAAPRLLNQPKLVLSKLMHNSPASKPVTILPVFENERVALRQTFEAHLTRATSDRPLMVHDAGVLQRQYERWMVNLPIVRPFYAVKCCPDDVMIEELAALGTGFDCATSAEIEAVLAKGVSPRDIIFANPIKTFPDLEYARKVGVTKMTFDNADELHKINSHHPEAELVLRLLPDDSGSVMRFGSKFGTPLPQVSELLSLSKKLGMNLIGVSFHIGSGCFEPAKYNGAIALCRTVFDMAAAAGLPAMKFLDLGGGFPGNPIQNAPCEDGVPSFEQFCRVITTALEENFPRSKFNDLQIISEPGRYFATAWGTLFTKVQGKRACLPDGDSKRFLYYVNDGVYGSFNCMLFDHAKPLPHTLEDFFKNKQSLVGGLLDAPDPAAPPPIYSQINGTLFSPFASAPKKLAFANGMSSKAALPKPLATIFGPTCDSMDKIVEDHAIRELHVGEWLAFKNMGAYTTAAGTRFNGCHRPILSYVRSTYPL